MRLELLMRRPVVLPDLDPETVFSSRRPKTATEAWQTYGEALLEGNEHCMEMSESAEELFGADSGKDSWRLLATYRRNSVPHPFGAIRRNHLSRFPRGCRGH